MEKILLQIPLALFMWCLVVFIQGIQSKLYLKHYMRKAEQLENELEGIKQEIASLRGSVLLHGNMIETMLRQMVIIHERIDALRSELKRGGHEK